MRTLLVLALVSACLQPSAANPTNINCLAVWAPANGSEITHGPTPHAPIANRYGVTVPEANLDFRRDHIYTAHIKAIRARPRLPKVRITGGVP